MARIRVCLPLFFLVTSCLAAISSFGQEAAPIVQTATPVAVTTPNLPIAVPTPTGVLGHLDAAAVSEFAAHKLAVGGSSWTGMQAAGHISYGSNPTAYPVSLSNFGHRAFRLDVTTLKGTTSTRILGFVGKQREADGIITGIALDNCVAGLFPFEMVRAVPLESPSVTLADGGLNTLDGVTLHRVTLERATIGRNPTTKKAQTTVIDLYFDPGTHLLVKSRSPVDIGRNVKLISEVAYSDYRLVGIVKVPFHFEETLDGQLYRSLQLSSVSLIPILDPTLFTF